MVVFAILAFGPGRAAPYAAMVIDARSGEVLHSRNADTRLHPASLTKMMTLYVVFDAVERGEIGLDDYVTVSQNAAAEPPSKLYLKTGQRIRLRYLIRASAVKSANDAATAMAEAISGSEAAFARRMTNTARALGMTNTTFRNAHGLTESGHLSTARDMTKMGRALFYHFPDYYNLFSRRSANAAGKTVYNTNRKLLAAYSGADGIKTGYTRAAGFNLVASARRGDERIIATMFGGSTAAARNARVAELLSMGFQRAPSRVAVNAPGRPTLAAISGTRLAVVQSDRPLLRPAPAKPAPVVAALQQSAAEAAVAAALAQGASTATPPDNVAPRALIDALEPTPKPEPTANATSSDGASSQTVDVAATGPAAEAALAEAAAPSSGDADATVRGSALAASAAPAPLRRPAVVTFSTKGAGPNATQEVASRQEGAAEVVVANVAASNGRNWGVNVGTYPSRYAAERMLLKTALIEIETLDGALRKVVRQSRGFEANFVGLSEQTAQLACQRLAARDQSCETFGP
jgi:D-alanyl-D-alanine carboxypeptidase